MQNDGLGSLSRKYESGNSGPGTIAKNSGDIGGASYGTYQIATHTGTMTTFLRFLKTANISMYQALAKYSIGSSDFDAAWKALADNYSQEFNEIQHKFIKVSHYDLAVRKLNKSLGIDINKRTVTLQNVVWSTAVHHGATGALTIFRNAKIQPSMSDEEIIKLVYAERGANNGMRYFPRSSTSIRRSVVNRFTNELQDALAMLSAERRKIYRLVTDPFANKKVAERIANGIRKTYNIIVHVMVEKTIYIKTGTFKDKQKAGEIAKGIKRAYGVTVHIHEV